MGDFLKKILISLIGIGIFINSFVFADGISARSYILIEQSSNTVVAEKNSEIRMKPASTTKILTAICAIENASLDDVVTVSRNAAYQEGSSMYLKPGDKITLEDLVYGLMLNSGNDAAVAIAEHIGGSTEKFANIMNNKAKDIGAKNSNFENPNGLDSDNHYVTAKDLALITSYALKNQKFREIVSTKSKVVSTVGGVSKYLANHNKLLHMYENCIGVKTGFTKASGRTLVSAADKNGITLIAVTLNAPNDWNDHKLLLDKGYQSVKIKKILDNYSVVDYVDIKNGTKESVEVKCEEEYSAVLLNNEQENFDVIYEYKTLKAPVRKMQNAGIAKVYKNGKLVFETNLITVDDVDKKNNFSFFEWIKRIFRL